jgi:CPA2 family monovalent cation:H+ antiporter-2
MAHHAPLITTLVAALGLAFVLGALAQRIRISPLVGYLVAGVLVGPFTPGFVADQNLASQLAEIGVILLMFGVGLHFSLKDLLSVRRIAIPGAVAQMAVATLFGMALARVMGWSVGAGLVFGLALSVASTVVLIRALQERHMLDSERGRIAVGWLIVEDLAMVVVLVLLPAVAGLLDATLDASAGGGAELQVSRLAARVGFTLLAAATFVAVMLVIGRRVIPSIFHYVAHTGSRELFRLAVLAVALGVAFGAAELFGVSFALGAFFAGMVLSGSELSQRAAEESLPLRDAFAVLFFVSVGMLLDPMVLVRDPWPVVGTVLIIVLGKSIAAFLMVQAFGHPLRTALTISASLAQIGEFSFILASLGMSLGLFPDQGRDLIVAGAILSILLNPILFAVLDRFKPWLDRREARAAPAAHAAPTPETGLPVTTLTEHAVLIGFGRVGSIVGEGLLDRKVPLLVIEDRREIVERLRACGLEVIHGNAADPSMIKSANLAAADLLFVAIPDAFEAGQIIQQARAANPDIEIIARAHSDAEVEHLSSHGANLTIMGEREIGLAMLNHAFGWRAQAADRAPRSPADTMT